MSQRKKLYLEVVRVIAVLLVIFNHTDGFVYYTVQGNIVTHLYSLILAILCRMAVPLFFMVSGALLLGKEESLSELFRKRIARMLIVLAAVSVFYYLFDIIIGRIASPGAGDFISRLLANEIRDSFWFLYAYIGVLLLLPFFRKVVPFGNKKLVIYLIGLRVLTDLAVPLLNLGMGIAVSFDFGFVGDYYYYMLLGYYFDREEIEGLRKGKSILVLALLVVLSGMFTCGIKAFSGTYHAVALDFFIFLMAPVTFGMIKSWLGGTTKSGKAEKWILAFGSCVFGIYLFDNFLRWQLLPVYLFLSEKTMGIFANSVYVLLTFLGGFIYTWILKRIPVIRRYL
ncbi:MAG: acyltransferase [Lachnospiraceae bacterium]|nr:acyltransferase [Lachnospiraceae bacterium]